MYVAMGVDLIGCLLPGEDVSSVQLRKFYMAIQLVV